MSLFDKVQDSDWHRHKEDFLWLVMAYLHLLENRSDSALILDASVQREARELLASRSDEILETLRQRGARTLVTELRQEYVRSGHMGERPTMTLDGGRGVSRGIDYELLWLLLADVQLFTGAPRPRRHFTHDFVDQMVAEGDSKVLSEFLALLTSLGAFGAFRKVAELAIPHGLY